MRSTLSIVLSGALLGMLGVGGCSSGSTEGSADMASTLADLSGASADSGGAPADLSGTSGLFMRKDNAAGLVDILATGDFNGDQKLDLVSADFNLTDILVHLGNGAGGFAAPLSTTIDGTPLSVAVGDFNNDQRLDVAVSNKRTGVSSATLRVMFGDGQGRFSGPRDVTVTFNPATLAAGDFTGDQRPDLVMGINPSMAAGSVISLRNDGTGTFTTGTAYPVSMRPASIAVGDFNADQKLDFVAVNGASNTADVYLGNGNGTFNGTSILSTGMSPASVAVGDFNGDQKLDFATANLVSRNVSVLLGNGSGGFANAVHFAVDGQAAAVVVNDFNNDGKPDLAVAAFFMTDHHVSVLLGNGQGGFAAPVNLPVDQSPLSLVTGDFNGDRKPDLVSGNVTNRTISVLLNQSP